MKMISYLKNIVSRLIFLAIPFVFIACSNGDNGDSGSKMGGSIQGILLSLSRDVTTFSGTAGSFGAVDGAGVDARFNYPWEITTDGTHLYITDESTIRKISIASGIVSTLAGKASLSGSVDGTGVDARFLVPRGVTTDGTNLYVVDSYNSTIRKIVIETGVVNTIAGTAGISGTADGTGATAQFNLPGGITTDGANLYVTEPYSHTIRKIVIDSGVVTTLAGTASLSGSADGTRADARFDTPAGITTDGKNLFVAGNRTVRKIVIATGVVTTLAGNVSIAGSTDGTGDTARFAAPAGITSDGTHLYVTDNNRIIRKITIATSAVTTLAGDANSLGSDDGTGVTARFDNPIGITTDGTYLYVVDRSNHTIRKIN